MNFTMIAMQNFIMLLLCKISPCCCYAKFHHVYIQYVLKYQPCYFLYFKKYYWHWLMDFLPLESTSVKMKNDWCIFTYRIYFSQMTEGFSPLRISISQRTEPFLEMLSHLKMNLSHYICHSQCHKKSTFSNP